MVGWRSDAAHPRHSLSAPGSRALTTRARDPVPPVGSSQPSTPKATYPAVPDHSNHHIDRDWQHRAPCLGTDTERFFSPDGERGNVRAQREHAAKPICQDCPVLAECRTHALAATEAYGIWGGMSETSAPARPDVPASRPGPGSTPRHRTLEPRRTRARHEVEQSRPPTTTHRESSNPASPQERPSNRGRPAGRTRSHPSCTSRTCVIPTQSDESPAPAIGPV